MDKEKLQLKHIAPYLPYGLRFINKNGAILRMDAMQTNGYKVWAHKKYTKGVPDESDINYKYLNSLNCSGEGYFLRQVKPILRPLSDLVKPLPSGEIPFIKLFEMYNRNEFSETPYKKKECDKIISCDYVYYEFLKSYECILKYAFETSNMGTLVYSFRYDPQLRRFLHRDETHERPLGVSHQIDLFNFLFEHHFDVYGLCEKGLAIDINKINE